MDDSLKTPSPHPRVPASPRLRVPSSPRRRVAAALFLLALLLTACAAPVQVEWRTETEMNTAGFNLYRSESPEGPFDVKVNEQLIPPATDPLTGSDYTYVDRAARAGVTYYYQLQEVERSGQVNTYGPISVRAGGLAWWHFAALAVLGGLAAFIWLRGGRVVKVGPPPGGQRSEEN